MSVVVLDVAGCDPQQLTSGQVAEEWLMATGVPAVPVTLTDGRARFVEIMSHQITDSTRYLAAVEYATPGDLARDVVASSHRVCLATASHHSWPIDGGAGFLIELAVLGGYPREGAAASLRAGDVAAATSILQAAREVCAAGLVGAVDGDQPLLGQHGVAAQLRHRDPVAAHEAEQSLGIFADLIWRAHQRLLPSLVSQPTRLSMLAGAGSGGGLGHIIAALGGVLRPCVEVSSHVLELRTHLANAAVVVVVTPVVGATEMTFGVIPLVTQLAHEYAVPVVVITGECIPGRREWLAAGISAVYEDASVSIATVAQTWTPPGQVG